VRGVKLIRLEKSEALQRKIRRDDIPELAIPTWTLVRDAVKAGKIDEALELLDYGCYEAKQVHDILAAFPDIALTYIVNRCGEEEIMKVLRGRYYDRAKDFIARISDPKEALQRLVEQQRAHFSDFTVVEEPDRYVVIADPCGSGGRLRRIKDVGVTKKAYPWSWSKVGIPYYCCHCCAYFEIFPTELRGYPIRIHEVTDKPEDPCIHYYYKEPKLIPEEYFTRIGMSKTVREG